MWIDLWGCLHYIIIIFQRMIARRSSGAFPVPVPTSGNCFFTVPLCQCLLVDIIANYFCVCCSASNCVSSSTLFFVLVFGFVLLYLYHGESINK